MRADQLLVDRGLAATRSQAQRLIAAGVRWRGPRGWQPVAKNGDDLPDQAEIELLDDAPTRYVSRGGLKLEGALAASGVDPSGTLCLDVGQSTGGFTDCLLQAGARLVVGVDVGQGQLHPRLQADVRVVAIEGLNARHLAPEDLPHPLYDLVTGDLSFISLTRVLPALAPRVAPGGHLLMLVKPQFELQPGQIGKGGVVRDATLYPQVRERIEHACEQAGLQPAGWYDSPITGGDGNREFFVHARSVQALRPIDPLSNP